MCVHPTAPPNLFVIIRTETKFALDCWKRKTALEKRFRRARIISGKVCPCAFVMIYNFSCSARPDISSLSQRPAADDHAYTLEHAVLDSDRMEMASLQAEYRNRKAELDKIEREKKAIAAAAAPMQAPPPAARTSYYPPTSTSVSNSSTRASTPASGAAGEAPRSWGPNPAQNAPSSLVWAL